MCINALSDCLDEIGPDQIICVGASPIQPLPVPRLRFRLRTPVENPHCYAMLCRLLSISDSVSQSPCRFRGRRLAIQSIFMDLFMSPVSHFRIPRFSHFSLWQLATGEGGHVQYSGSEDDEENNKHWNQGGELQMAK